VRDSRSDLVDTAGRAQVELRCDEREPPPRDYRFGLLGPLFSHERLHDGTAFWPWQYVFNVGLSISQCANTVLGGDPDESLSSRLGRGQSEGLWPVSFALAPAVDLLIGPDHCDRCIEYDERFEKELWTW
jgi:hypothetical protein